MNPTVTARSALEHYTEQAQHAAAIEIAKELAAALRDALAEVNHHAPRGKELGGAFADQVRNKGNAALLLFDAMMKGPRIPILDGTASLDGHT